MGELSLRMAADIRSRGGIIHLSTRIERLLLAGSKIGGLQINGRFEEYDWIVSSMPLPLLIRALQDVPESVKQSAQLLKSRNTILVYLRVDTGQLFPYNWLYVYSPGFKVGRITNFGMWRESIDGDSDSILSMEYWCSDGDGVWTMTDADVIELARDELARTGLTTRHLIRDGHAHRIRGSHPVYEKGYKSHVRHIRDFVDSIEGLLTTGRHGTVSFNSISDSILAGVGAAERIIGSEEQRLRRTLLNDDSNPQ
jgi:protoporphyrinogen oxidase